MFSTSDESKFISERSTGREEFTKQKDEIRGKLDDLSAQIDKLEKERGSMQTSIDAKQQAGREARQELNSMKKKLGYESEEAIDQKIKEIEYQMMTESLTLKKEKEMLVQISQLKASKPDIKKYAAMESTIGVDGQVSNIRKAKDDIMSSLKDLRDRKREQQALYSKLIETRQKQMLVWKGLARNKELVISGESSDELNTIMLCDAILDSQANDATKSQVLAEMLVMQRGSKVMLNLAGAAE